MQGSLEDWILKGGDTDHHEVKVPKAKDILKKLNQTIGDQAALSSTFAYKANKNPSYIYTIEDILQKINNQSYFSMREKNDNEIDYVIIDSRGSSFIKGSIPTSINVPYNVFTEPHNSLIFKKKEELVDLFHDAGVDPFTKKTIVCSCNSGVSACTLFLALELCGRNVDVDSIYMYDGSWSEYGKEKATPKIKPK
jgi:thiosulfate/3-mercaptopyruvate sulfurtransferase